MRIEYQQQARRTLRAAADRALCLGYGDVIAGKVNVSRSITVSRAWKKFHEWPEACYDNDEEMAHRLAHLLWRGLRYSVETRAFPGKRGSEGISICLTHEP